MRLPGEMLRAIEVELATTSGHLNRSDMIRILLDEALAARRGKNKKNPTRSLDE
jgi:metal-responsive CopG/Arc/MetJ family transcriptional regulator